MTIAAIRVRATFDAVSWDDDSEDPNERGGWVDPLNPWGSFEQDSDDDSAEPDTVLCTAWEAAELVHDFPGAVWDYSDNCDAEQNIRTGEWKRVTLHVLDHPETVFALADTL